MFLSRFRNRLRKRVTKQELQNELFAIGDVQQKQGEMLQHIVAWLRKLSERMDCGFEGLEKNDMGILENLDKQVTRIIETQEAQSHKPDDGKKPSEAQVMAEWFGEDEV